MHQIIPFTFFWVWEGACPWALLANPMATPCRAWRFANCKFTNLEKIAPFTNFLLRLGNEFKKIFMSKFLLNIPQNTPNCTIYKFLEGLYLRTHLASAWLQYLKSISCAWWPVFCMFQFLNAPLYKYRIMPII